jgi:hypothetical protein
VVIIICSALNGVAQTSASAQAPLPFSLSNPRHLKWSSEEAGRIYTSACELVARSIRPERPPHLHPSFVVVLGTKDNSIVWEDATSEIHLKTWDPAHFAEAVVLMATREVLNSEDVTHLTRDTLIAAEASVSVNELRRKR